MTEKRTYSHEGPTCPYCGHVMTPDEGYFHDEHRYTEQECPECEKAYSVEVNNWTSWGCRPKEPKQEAVR